MKKLFLVVILTFSVNISLFADCNFCVNVTYEPFCTTPAHAYVIVQDCNGGQIYGSGWTDKEGWFCVSVPEDHEIKADVTDYVCGVGSTGCQTDYCTVSYKVCIIPPCQSPMKVEDNTSSAKDYELYQNFPNPFNPVTYIKYYIPKESFVELVVFDASGKRVSSLVSETQETGSYGVAFDASSLPSGVYFYKLIAGEFVKTMKMIVLK